MGRTGAELVRTAQQHLTQQLLDRPAALPELAGKIIEQHRVAGPRAELPEVINRQDDPATD